MSISWSKKLFLKINTHIGRSKIFDACMYFFAVVLIYILGAVVIGWGAFVLFDTDPSKFNLLIKLLLTAHLFGIGISYIIAAVWRHPRPVVHFPEIKQIFKTMETWKSFPSDHTTIAFLFVFITLMLGASLWFGVVLIVLASTIAVSRIYCGVHYPGDIIGGVVWAGVIALLSPWLLEYVTQPIYNGVKLFF